LISILSSKSKPYIGSIAECIKVSSRSSTKVFLPLSSSGYGGRKNLLWGTSFDGFEDLQAKEKHFFFGDRLLGFLVSLAYITGFVVYSLADPSSRNPD